jgi:hypothetical protein
MGYVLLLLATVLGRLRCILVVAAEVMMTVVIIMIIMMIYGT